MGYIGPCVVEHLRTKYPDSRLIGFDIGFFGNCLTTNGVIPESRLDVQYFGDMRDFPESILKDVDAIVHLAAISNDPIGNRFEDVTLDINYRSSIDLATKAKKAGVKSFVFASSCSMYGTAADAARTENSPLNPLTAYAKSKVLTEQQLEPLADKSFKVTSLRFSTACGMSSRLRLDLVLNDFVAGAVASKNITILSDGTPWRPLINVKDMACAIDWAIQRNPGAEMEFLAVNVGSDEWNYQVKDLAYAVAEVIPDVDISINKDAASDKRSYRVNFDLFRQLAPDHQPRIDLVESVRQLKSGLEGINFCDSNFRESSFMRLKVLLNFMDNGILNDHLEWI